MPKMRIADYINEVIPEAQDQSNFDMTQVEIAQRLGMQRESINGLEKRAMKKFKAVLKQKGFKKEELL